MKLNCNSFFDGEFSKINLNNYFSICGFTDSSKPEEFQNCLDKLKRKTYGGYGENRGDIFKNSYLAKTKKFIHLGIDINVPAGTPVKCPLDCRIYEKFIDKDTDIGWGGRLILYTEDLKFLVLAHLEPKTMIKTKKHCAFIKEGTILGYVGSFPTNGNSFSHLHVQCFIDGEILIRGFDGYGTKKDLKKFPNPFEVEF